jgi:hypothetical protein
MKRTLTLGRSGLGCSQCHWHIALPTGHEKLTPYGVLHRFEEHNCQTFQDRPGDPGDPPTLDAAGARHPHWRAENHLAA